MPDWKTIRRFRRLRRQELSQCLDRVVQQALHVRFANGEPDPTPVDHCVAQAMDRWFEPLCVPFPAMEAAQRIEKATLADATMID